MRENEITELVIGCAIHVHRQLGPCLLESAYEACLFYELRKYDPLFVENQKAMPLIYEEVKLDCGYRVDFLINNKVIVEVKAVEKLDDVHLAQVLTYLKLSDCKVWLLINFNVVRLTSGINES